MGTVASLVPLPLSIKDTMTTKTTSAEPVTRGGEARRSQSLTRYFPTAARVFLGFLLFASGATGLLHLMPPPPANLPEAAVAFNTGMMKTGYMMPLIFGTQVVVGALLLFNRFVPLALAMLAPFLVNSFAFHVFLVPSGLLPALVILALELYLAWTYRAAFLPMLAARTAPANRSGEI